MSPDRSSRRIEPDFRKHWPLDAGLAVGLLLTVAGLALLGVQIWLWAVVALLLAGAVFVLRWEAGRRRTGAALGTARTRLAFGGALVGARSRGQLDLFRQRRELAELQAERSRGYHELGRATHAGDVPAAEAAAAHLDDVNARIAEKEAEIGALVGEMEERVRRVQTQAAPAQAQGAETPPDDPPQEPEHPPAPQRTRRLRSRVRKG